MSDSISFGLTLPQRGALFGATTIRELLDLTQEADANPLFDSVWVGDSLMAKPRPESLTLLGALAGPPQTSAILRSPVAFEPNDLSPLVEVRHVERVRQVAPIAADARNRERHCGRIAV